MTADKERGLLRECAGFIRHRNMCNGITNAIDGDCACGFISLNNRITAALAEKDDDGKVWMPIETAPKDGTKIKLLCEFGEDEGFYCDYTKRSWNPSGLPGEWSTDKGNGDPTHWRPLPPLPKGE